MRHPEWSLILFTLISQLAIGSFVLISFLNVSKISNIIIQKDISIKVFVFILSFSLIALTISFLHLGKPTNSVFAFNNLGSSWLSREILFISLFVGIVIVSLLIEKFFPDKVMIKAIIQFIGSCIGIMAIFSMSKVYMAETIPVWNNFFTPFQFFSSMLILGFLFFLIGGFLSNTNTNVLLAIIISILFINVLGFAIKLLILSAGNSAEIESFTTLFSTYRLITIGYFLVSFFVILIFIINSLFINHSSGIYLSSITILIVLVELISRYLFYAGYSRLGI